MCFLKGLRGFLATSEVYSSEFSYAVAHICRYILPCNGKRKRVVIYIFGENMSCDFALFASFCHCIVDLVLSNADWFYVLHFNMIHVSKL